MRTWLSLLVVMVAVLAALLPGGPPAPALAQAPASAPCITDDPQPGLPPIVTVGQDIWECLIVDEVRAIFGSSVPMPVTLSLSGRRWAEVERSAGPVQVTQWREGNTLYLTLARTIQPVSQATFVPHTQTIALAEPLPSGEYTLRLNNVTLALNIPQQSPTSGETPPGSPPALPAGSIRSYAAIQAVQVSTDLPLPARVTLIITGTHAFPGGECASPLQIQQDRAGNRITVELYRVIDTTRSCRTERTRIAETVRLRGSFEAGTYELRVNDYVQRLTIPPTAPPPPPPPGPIRRDAVIESVTVLRSDGWGMPARLTLHVTGYLPDGCGGPLQIEQQRSGNRVQVALYQWVEPWAICPMILQLVDEYIPLHGTFGPGTYWLQVNAYGLWYTLPPGEPVPRPGAETS